MDEHGNGGARGAPGGAGPGMRAQGHPHAHADVPEHPGADRNGAFDIELDVRRIVLFGVVLGVTVIVVLAAVGVLAGLWKRAEESRDPRRSPLAGARASSLPPEPRLQTAPPKDMEHLRAEEQAVLTSYGWVDRQAGIGRIPIARALDILAPSGLPDQPAPAPASAGEPHGGASPGYGRAEAGRGAPREMRR